MPKYRLVKTSTTKPDNLSSFLVTYDMVGKKKKTKTKTKKLLKVVACHTCINTCTL